MELLLSFVPIVLAAAVLTAKCSPQCGQQKTELQIKKRIADIDTLLQNIEAYDGTSNGQKPIGGDGR